MTRDQIIKWRNLADEYARNQSSDHYEQREISDERFAQLARASAFDDCIDIVAMHGGSVEIEAAIRARKD